VRGVNSSVCGVFPLGKRPTPWANAIFPRENVVCSWEKAFCPSENRENLGFWQKTSKKASLVEVERNNWSNHRPNRNAVAAFSPALP
jgi:hypothetical protein